MNSVAGLLSADAILLDLDVQGKAALFQVIGKLWQGLPGLCAEDVADSLNAREKLGSTGLGSGIAIPHARIAGLTEAIAAFVRPKTPIEFDSPDGKPVTHCFVLLVPEKATEQHLQILAEVAEMLSSSEFRGRLTLAKNVAEVAQLFAGWQPA